MKRLVLCLIFGAVGGFLGVEAHRLATPSDKFCFQEAGSVFEVVPITVSLIALTSTGQSMIADVDPQVIKDHEPLVACPKAP